MGFLEPMPILIQGSKKFLIFDISANIICIISDECGYQILVTKIYNEGRVSYILTNVIHKFYSNFEE